MSLSSRRPYMTALFLAVIIFAAPIAILPVDAEAATESSGPYFGAGNLPPGCVADMQAEELCHHMRTDMNGLDSPQVDVLVLVPASPTAERDMRIMRQSIEMWEGGIDHLAGEMGLDWLAEGVDFHISVDHFDPVGGQGGEFTTYPIVDPEIVVIATNPVGGAGIGIDPVAHSSDVLGVGGLDIYDEDLVPCHNVPNPLDFDYWENLPGFDSHHDGRSGTYVEDCEGAGGNVCFAINGAIDPDPNTIDIFGLFDLVSHEVGHCLTLGHVGDGGEGAWSVTPTNDIMAYSQDPPGGTKCVSTLDVEGFATRMSKYLDVNGDGAVTNEDKLDANDPIGVGDPIGVPGFNPFQVQHPEDHFYASSTREASDCPQPDLGLVPGPRTDWTPEPGGTTDPDGDKDGIPDANDNCPLVGNSDQQDSDGDGAGDACEAGPRTLYMDGDTPVGEVDQAPLQGYLALKPEPGSQQESMGIPNYAGGPNTTCAGNSLMPVFVGDVSGRIVGDMEVTFPTLGSGGTVEIRVWPDVTSQQCDEPAYPTPAGSVQVALPAGQGTVQATIPDLDFVAESSMMIQITPVLESGPAYARAFYGTSESSTTFCVIPTGAAGEGCGATEVDSDGDGVPDATDNCPDVANTGQEDADGDGTGDACETNEPDGDGDGVPDAEDNCPDVANAGQADSDGDGTGDACEDSDPGGVIFEGAGRITAANPASSMAPGGIRVGGITESEYLVFCDGLEPFSQGLDGWVFLLDETITSAATADLVGTDSLIGEHDLDMYFYSEDCRELGAANTAAVDETASVPSGTRWIIADQWLGADTLATLTVTSGGGNEPADTDGDGVNDDVDNCPAVANGEQNDSDGDGRGDACDGDRDGDGVENETDNCADVANPGQQDSDGDGKGDACDVADPGCAGTPDPVYFLGIAYDSEQREDFIADARNFETYLAKLRDTYCIPSSQATILNMEGPEGQGRFTDPTTGKTYDQGTEANLKAELRRMAEESAAHEDSQFFFFLSSHGLMYNGASEALLFGAPECTLTRAAGSYSGLKAGGGEDGLLYDCELGAELGAFDDSTRQFVAVDCSFCGGFSDSLTAVSGTIPDGSVPTSSGIPADNRVVITGCAITTECFGSSPSSRGGNLYHRMTDVINGGIAACDGWTAPGFPTVQGFDVPVNGAPFNAPDGICTASEWFFGAVDGAYKARDPIDIQQQFRIKYGMGTLANDIVILDEGDDLPPTDTDGDGVADEDDNCPNDANADQADTDGDGIGDACDEAEPVDTDGDGVADEDDNCPNNANAGQADTDGDGIGDACDAAATTLAFTSGTSGQHGDETQIAARLTENEGGTPVSDAELVFELVGETGSVATWNATTDADGVATSTRTLNHDAGAYNLTVRYAGQADNYEASSSQTGFVIDPEATAMTLDVRGKGKNRVVTATLAEDDGAPLDRMLVFYATDKEGVRREIHRAATENGTVSFTPSEEYRGGPFNFEAVFEGERNHTGSSAQHQT